MELWAAGIALLIIAMGILVLILCREKIHKSLRKQTYKKSKQ